MPGANFILDKGYQPTGAVRKFRVVTKSTSNKEQCAEAASAGAMPLGVCQEEISADDATKGRVADIRVMGASRCIAGEVMATIGVPVRTDNQGRVVTLAAATANQNQLGILQTAAAAVGDHVDVLLTPGAARTTV
jgi:hypothetical protein